MDCNTVQQHLGAFLDNELAIEKAKKIRTHLFKCEHCEQKAAELKKTYDFINDDVQLHMDAFFTTRLHAELQQRNSRRHKFKLSNKILIPTGVFAGVLLGVLISAGVYSQFKTPNYQSDYIDYDIFSLAPQGSFTDGYATEQNIQFAGQEQ